MKKILPLFISLVCLIPSILAAGTNGVKNPSKSKANYAAPPPTVVVDTVINNLCNGGSTGQIQISLSGGIPAFTFLWSNGSTLQNQTGLTAGTYYVTITDGAPSTVTASFTVTQPDQITLGASFSNLTCFGDTDGEIDLTPLGGVSPYSFLWSTTSTTEDVSGLSAGTYTVTLTDANGCVETNSFTITQPAAFSIPGTVVNAGCFEGSDGSIDINVTGGTSPYTYFWEDFATDEDRFGLAAGTYTVQVYDFNNCSSTASFTIGQPTELTGDGYIQNLLCFGENNGSIYVVPAGGTSPYSYIWSNGATTDTISNLIAGFYTVFITDANFCSVNYTYEITQPNFLTIPATVLNVSCANAVNGSIDLQVAGGSIPYTYLWDDFSTIEDRSGLDVGIYTVSVTDLNSCTATASFSITQPDELLADAYIESNFCFGQALGTIDLDVTGGTLPYTFAWSNGSTSEDLSGLTADLYTVTISDSLGCIFTQTYNVTEPAEILISSSIDNVSCIWGSDATIDITISGGTSPYTYLWEDFSTDQDRSGLPVGVYTVVVSDFNNCSATATFTVTQPEELLADAYIESNYCFGDALGNIDVDPYDGTAPYFYLWSNGETTDYIDSLPAGSYTVTITDNNGCTVSYTYTLTQPVPVTVTANVVNISCYSNIDGSIDITAAGGNGPYTYFWEDFTTNEDRSGLTSGTYTVVATDINGCTGSAVFTIVEPGELLADAYVDHILCFGELTGAIDLEPYGGTPYYPNTFLYNWSNGATSQDLSGLGAGTYTVTITDSTGCSISYSYTVTQPAQLLINPTVTQINCYGNANGSIDINPTGGTAPYTYLWEDFSTDQDRSGLDVGIYTVSVTDYNNCTVTASFEITTPGELLADAYIDHLLCNGEMNGSIDLDPYGGTAPYTYVWSNGETTQDISGLSGGTYTVLITDVNGCTISYTYTVNEPTAITIGATVTNSSCYLSANGTIDITPSGGTAPYTFIWEDFSTNEDRSGLDVGTYTVVVSDYNNCTTTASFTITQPDELLADAYVDNNFCFGEVLGAIDLEPYGGTAPYTYVWSNGETTQDIDSLAAGTYTVLITDFNGCQISYTYNVTEPPLLVATGSVTNVTCFGYANGSIDVSVTGGTAPYTYLWNDFDTNEDRSGFAPGVYTVEVTDFNNCSTTASFTVTEPDTLLVSAIIDDLECFGDLNGAIDIAVTGGTIPYNYNWSNGQTTEDISGLSAGIYTVNVVDANGCSVTYTFEVTQPPLLVVTGTQSNVTCFAYANGTIDITAGGGTPGYTYLWSDFDTNEDRSGLAPDT